MTGSLLAVLGGMGPPQMALLELAGTAELANRWIVGCELEQIRNQLLVDFLFLISYSTLLATACFTASRLWQAQANIRPLPRQDTAGESPATRPSAGTTWFRAGAALLLSLAWLQWVAGACDAVENVALLKFLYDRTSEFMPLIAKWAATFKFILVIVGCFGASIGFLSGPARSWKARTGQVGFALLLGLAGWFFACAFLRAL
jgi:hypothetical protein